MKIQNYYKKIKVNKLNGENSHTLFDYDKIWDDEAFIFLVISERGAKGKSTQAKRLARKIYHDHKLKTMWLMNTKILISKEKISHLVKPKQYLTDIFTGEEKIEGDRVYTNIKDKDSWYTKFSALSVAENEKGSRDSFGLIIYDEFNVGTGMIRTKQTDLISSLIATLSDPINTGDSGLKKMIIHGNFKSLNNDLLISLGVHSIKEEVTDVYIDGKLLMRILCPKFNEQDRINLEEENKDNPIFLFQKQIGKSDHVYFNDNLFDKVNNVDLTKMILKTISLYYLKIENRYYSLEVKEDDYEIFFVSDIEYHKIDQDYNIFAMDKRSVIEGIVLNTNLKNNLIKALANDKIYFSNAYVRENFIKEITK